MSDSEQEITEDREIYIKVEENYEAINENSDEEEGLVEYLDLDMEVMEDENTYFTVQHGQEEIYLQETPSSSGSQVYTVVPNASGEFQAAKSTSHQLNNQNGPSKVLWSKNIPVLNDAEVSIKSEKKSLNGGNTSKTRGKRKQSESEFDDNNSKSQEEKEEKPQVQIRNESDSLDLFFQSMAQTVLQLPPQAQAKVKMEICKLISTAEIQYCFTDFTSTSN